MAVDLKVSQIVDAPNFMVSAYLPLSIFAKPRAKAAPKRTAVKTKTKPRAKVKSCKLVKR